MTKVKVTLSKAEMSADNGIYQEPLDKETFEKIKKAEEEKIANRPPRRNIEDRDRGDRRGGRGGRGGRRGDRGDRGGRGRRRSGEDYKEDRVDRRDDRRDDKEDIIRIVKRIHKLYFHGYN